MFTKFYLFYNFDIKILICLFGCVPNKLQQKLNKNIRDVFETRATVTPCTAYKNVPLCTYFIFRTGYKSRTFRIFECLFIAPCFSHYLISNRRIEIRYETAHHSSSLTKNFIYK